MGEAFTRWGEWEMGFDGRVGLTLRPGEPIGETSSLVEVPPTFLNMSSLAGDLPTFLNMSSLVGVPPTFLNMSSSLMGVPLTFLNMSSSLAGVPPTFLNMLSSAVDFTSVPTTRNSVSFVLPPTFCVD